MAFFKVLIKQITPPIIIQLIKKIFFGKNNKKFTFIQIFETYSDAKKYSSEVSEYINEELEDKKSEFENQDKVLLEPKYNIVPIINSISQEKRSILEIGGGNNPIYNYIKKTTKNSIFSVILEKKSFVEKINKKIPKNLSKDFYYTYDLDLIDHNKFDIVFFGTSLQYLIDHEKIFNKIFKFNPELIIISRTFFNLKDKDFYVLQNNIEKSLFPYKMLSFKKFEDFLKKNNYKLIFEANYDTNYSHDSLDKKYLQYKDIIFKKNDVI